MIQGGSLIVPFGSRENTILLGRVKTQLEEDVIRTLSHDTLVLDYGKGTQKVHQMKNVTN